MNEIKKKIIFLVILLVLPFVSPIDNQLVTPGFGKQQISVSPNPANFQIFYFGKEYVSPNITLIVPFDNSEDSDGIVDFYYNVTDANQVMNCSLFLEGVYQTSNSSIIKNTQQFLRVVAPPVNERLEWIISCTDQFNNNGNSSTWHVKTKRGGESEIGGGGDGFFVNITDIPTIEPKTEEIEAPEKKNFLFPILIFILIMGFIALLFYDRKKRLVLLYFLLDESKEFTNKIKKLFQNKKSDS